MSSLESSGGTRPSVVVSVQSFPSQVVRGASKQFNVQQAGTDVETAFTVAREIDKWSAHDDLALKDAFIIANRPKGVSAEHFVRWLQVLAEDPGSDEVPEHHRSALLEVLPDFVDPHGRAVAVQCSWSEGTTHLWAQGHEIKRGKRRPNVYTFIGTVKD